MTATLAAAGAEPAPEEFATSRGLIARFRRNPGGMVGLVWIVIVVVVTIFATTLEPFKPSDLGTLFNHGPTGHNLLGTDSIGRDILSRLIASAPNELHICAYVMVISVSFALPIGLVAGFFGGRRDGVLMRIMDAVFALPPLMLAAAVAALLGPSVTHVAVAIAIPFIPGFARLVRAQVLAVREELYIEASRSVGVTDRRLVVRHVLPNVISPLIVQVALGLGYAMLAEAGLSFLGFGVQPPNASWGVMLQDAYSRITSAPWPMIPPGIAIALTVLAFNLVGDGLRDSLGREVFKVKEAG
jgi:ABC-type dipeptide/oligopeptide/nickel transport system permease subunit